MPIKILLFYEDESSDVIESTTDILTYTTIVTSMSKQLQITNNKPESPFLEPYAKKANLKYIDIEVNGIKIYTSKNNTINSVTYYNEFNVVLQKLREYIALTFIV